MDDKLLTLTLEKQPSGSNSVNGTIKDENKEQQMKDFNSQTEREPENRTFDQRNAALTP